VADAIRYGRCELRVNGGDLANGYATFAGMQANNDANDATAGYNRWGLFQSMGGTYMWKGLMTLGYSTAVDFRDSNRVIVIDGNVKKVSSNFNKIDIRQATSRVDWTSVSIISLSSVAKGNFKVVDNATVNFDSNAFSDMGTFIFQSNSTVTGTSFIRCGQVTQGGGTFSSCKFTGSTGTAALVVDDIAEVSNCIFTSSGTKYAIQGFSAAASYDISTLSFSGYASSDGSTGDEAIYVTATTGTVTLNYSGTAPSVRTAGATIVKQTGQVTLTITPIITGSDIVIYDHADNSVIESSQNISGTTHQFIYTYGGSYSAIDIGIFKEGYTPFYTRNYSLGSSNSSMPVAQVVDRFYIN
jgi:hypothetical protein